MSLMLRLRVAANLSWPGELPSRAAVAIPIAMLIGGIQFNPLVMGIAGAAVLGGIVAAGSNHSTARELRMN